MTWELVGKPKSVEITSKLAKEFSEMVASPQERQLSEHRIATYNNEVDNGRFRPCLWAKCFCAETELTYRVNGQHTSTMFFRRDLAQTKPHFAVLEEYICETTEDVAKLYATFDSKMQSRNTSDINRSFAAAVPELSEIPLRTINLLVTGISIDKWGLSGQKAKTPAERAEVLFDETDFCLWANSILNINGQHGHSHLKRIGVVAVMQGSYAKAKAKAEEFWTAVRDESDPSNKATSRKLAHWLIITNSDTAPAVNRRKRFKADTHEFVYRCVKAWNSWRKDKETDLKYYANVEIPAIV